MKKLLFVLCVCFVSPAIAQNFPDQPNGGLTVNEQDDFQLAVDERYAAMTAHELSEEAVSEAQCQLYDLEYTLADYQQFATDLAIVAFYSQLIADVEAESSQATAEFVKAYAFAQVGNSSPDGVVLDPAFPDTVTSREALYSLAARHFRPAKEKYDQVTVNAHAVAANIQAYVEWYVAKAEGDEQ